jgi:thiol-disulfide isomerase/thioredoxin
MLDKSPEAVRSPWFVSIFLFVSATLGAFAQPTGTPHTGIWDGTKKLGTAAAEKTRTGDLPIIDLEGYRNLLAERRGRPVVVSFWATWCEPCRDEFPLVNEMARRFTPRGIDFIGISLDDEADRNVARRFLAGMKPVFPSYRKKPGNEGEFIATVNPKWSGAIPATCLYDREGHLVAELVGASSRVRFEKALEDLLKTPDK